MSAVYGVRDADGVMTLDPALLRRIPRRQRRRTSRRREIEAEREELSVLVERLIARLDMLDGDADLEADADDEDTHDAELDLIELDLADDERSHNAPVSETTLGEAALLPRPMSPAAWERAAALAPPPEAPEGYVAIRVLPNRLVER